MNELIRNIANKAGFQYVKDEGIGWAGNHNASLSKFAELIIEECEQRLRTEGALAKIQAFTGSEYKFAYMNQAADIVKQHFGVK